MTPNYHSEEVEIREQRLGTIKVYGGTGSDLTQKNCQNCLSEGKRCFSTTSYCEHITAMLDIAVIQDVVVVDHGPVGCSAGIINWNVNYQGIAKMAGFSVRRLKIVSTNLVEADTVYGAIDKLKSTVRTAYYRHLPSAMFVLSTCVASIIGEDMESTVRELAQELNVPIGYVGCAGLRSKVWATGFDASKHAVINTLIKKPPQEKRRTVNFIDFFAQTTPTVVKYLAALDLLPQYLCSYSKTQDYDHLAEAVATTGVCKTLSSYLGAYLEETYNVPYLKTHFGIGGSEAFKNWFLDIARVVGEEEKALAFYNQDRLKYEPTLDELKRRLKGIRAVVTLGPGFAFDISRLLMELGLEVVHTDAHHFDPIIDGQGDNHTLFDYQNITVSVSDMQHYETFKILKKYQPDILVGRVHCGQYYALANGIPAVSLTGFESFGFDGIVTTGNLILENLANPNLVKKISHMFNPKFSDQFLDDERLNCIV
jgi:nitrogenase molybdenum-iron protein alpha chain